MSEDEKFIEFTEEDLRLLQRGGDIFPWDKWGPYVSERAWGTVREDYSKDGNAWNHFPFEMAHSRAYRWGEDGIGGICDRYQVMTLTHGFWNGKDPILKERLYGLGTSGANHGEDVKEYYYYLDCLPTHAYMKYLYKYPCEEYPYEDLSTENKKRGLTDREYELVDTGIFKQNRYFDIYIEYAKSSRDDICLKIEIFNRSFQEESIDYIPQITFRNSWSWKQKPQPKPVMKRGMPSNNCQSIECDDSNAKTPSRLNFDYHLGKRYFYADKKARVLFTENESNKKFLRGEKHSSPYVKDAFHKYIIHNDQEAINPKEEGTKACFYFPKIKILPGKSEVIYLRLTPNSMDNPLDGIEETIQKRKRQADEHYEKLHPTNATKEEKLIQRQALAGMLWTKQIYLYDVNLWIKGDNPDDPPLRSKDSVRNTHWKHLISKRILSMPDKWEYPWFAAWDLAFHCITLALIDINFAKDQLLYLLFDQFQHPNGQVPAYEWDFSDLNPPVQGWAALRLFRMEEKKTGKRDIKFLKKCYHKLLLNFVWWVNKVDSSGNNVFEGGFLGLDNITIFDRSKDVPGGGKLEQSDGTGWMGFFCLTMMRISLEVAKEDPVYEGMAIKFFQHFVYIANALVNNENRDIQNWDEKDGFFYDVLSINNKHQPIKVRSLVGLIPIFPVDCITEEDLKNFKEFAQSFKWFIKNRQDLCCHCVTPITENGKTKYLLTLMEVDKIKQILSYAWDPNEFRSPYGLRSLSKFYEKNPYELLGNSINYQPGESSTILKGGNSNWRGPIWFPTSFLFIEALKTLHDYTGDLITIDGKNPYDMAHYFSHSMINLFKKRADGKRPIYGDCDLFQTDPHFQDLILFYEHFHGDNGEGLGASHQTGWTGLIANLIDEWC